MSSCEKALKEVGESGAQIFEVHQMMLEDDDYNDSVKSIIETQMVNAEYAVATTGDNFAAMFAAMEDEYFQARAVDMKDISERVIDVLMGIGEAKSWDEPSIIVAEDLAPSETVQFDKSKLLGFVTKLGSSNSHTAILARTMNIPALIQIDIQEEWNGKMAVIDGFSGEFYIDPEPEILEKVSGKKRRAGGTQTSSCRAKRKTDGHKGRKGDQIVCQYRFCVRSSGSDEQ